MIDEDCGTEKKNSRISTNFYQVDGQNREKWSSKIDFLLSTVGLCVGLGNVWRFPYLCYENGGGVFLIPYLLTLVLAGVPILLLEMSVGQMKSIGGLGVWKFCPAFKGVGYAAMMMAFWLSIYYIVILAYALVYMAYSFTTQPVPWSSCNNTWNTERCLKITNKTLLVNCSTLDNITNLGYTINETKFNYSSSGFPDCQTWNSPVVEFWEREILKETKSISDPGGFNIKLAIGLLVAWILCYFCIWKGVKWTGKIVYFTALFPYVLLFCLFIRGVTLEGSAEGIIFYLRPNISKLFESKVWLDGATQIFFSYGLGLGTHIALGSYNPYNNNCYRDALIIGVVNTCTSLFSGFVVFSVLGYMAKQQNTTVTKVAKSGQGLVFLAYPAALAELPGAAIWSILFFFMILLIGLDSQFCTLEGFVTALIDEWPTRLRKHRKLLILAICSVSFLLGLSFTLYSGPFVFRLFDHYAASGMALLFLIFCECIAFSWCYGITRFLSDIDDMLGFKLPIWWKYCWLILCPAVCLSVLVFSLVYYEQVNYKGHTFPWWAHLIGCFLALSSTCMIPIYFIYYIIMKYKELNGSINFQIIMEILRPSITLESIRNDEYHMDYIKS